MNVRTFGAVVVLAAGVALGPALDQHVEASAGQRSGSRKWWSSDRFKTELGLNDDQATRLEAVFQEHLPRLRELKGGLDREEEALSALLRVGTGAEAVVATQIDRVESARSELSKLRTLMLFRMRRLLSADQRAALDELHRRDEAERHGNRPSASGGRQ
jgi:Spy/CpxP family protein refolding chaperone